MSPNWSYRRLGVLLLLPLLASCVAGDSPHYKVSNLGEIARGKDCRPRALDYAMEINEQVKWSARPSENEGSEGTEEAKMLINCLISVSRQSRDGGARLGDGSVDFQVEGRELSVLNGN